MKGKVISPLLVAIFLFCFSVSAEARHKKTRSKARQADCRCFNPAHNPVHTGTCMSLKKALKLGKVALPNPFFQPAPKALTEKIAIATTATRPRWFQEPTWARNSQSYLVSALYHTPVVINATDKVVVKPPSKRKFALVKMTPKAWDDALSAGPNSKPIAITETNSSKNVWSNYRFNRGLRGHHKGIDIGSPTPGKSANSPVHNLQNGTIYVAKVQTNRRGRMVGFGPYIGIDHGNHVCIFGHLPYLPKNPATGQTWKKGEKISKGQKIANQMGRTGNATGYIVHVEARLKKGDKLGKATDPRQFHKELEALRR